jgi:hypothetical protein
MVEVDGGEKVAPVLPVCPAGVPHAVRISATSAANRYRALIVFTFFSLRTGAGTEDRLVPRWSLYSPRVQERLADTSRFGRRLGGVQLHQDPAVVVQIP